MCGCLDVGVCGRMDVQMYRCRGVWTYGRMDVCKHVPACAWTYVSMYVPVHGCTHLCVQVYKSHVSAYTCKYGGMYICTYFVFTYGNI